MGLEVELGSSFEVHVVPPAVYDDVATLLCRQQLDVSDTPSTGGRDH